MLKSYLGILELPKIISCVNTNVSRNYLCSYLCSYFDSTRREGHSKACWEYHQAGGGSLLQCQPHFTARPQATQVSPSRSFSPRCSRAHRRRLQHQLVQSKCSCSPSHESTRACCAPFATTLLCPRSTWPTWLSRATGTPRSSCDSVWRNRLGERDCHKPGNTRCCFQCTAHGLRQAATALETR